MRNATLLALALAATATTTTLPTPADAGAWCAMYRRGSENCSYATLEQCLATVRGLPADCQPNPFPGTQFGLGGTWSSGPPDRIHRRYRGD
jgi:uncharacterized protein DUF3551